MHLAVGYQKTPGTNSGDIGIRATIKLISAITRARSEDFINTTEYLTAAEANTQSSRGYKYLRIARMP